ncbi:GH32 C-terminal domain-containing protein [Mangrovibacterium sp.]|uniref:GH32 C-terminal domain-containing protein n=1 Tax=Mangrovibacterium sp. TaxID=1961364 RepID=UPI0035631F66
MKRKILIPLMILLGLIACQSSQKEHETESAIHFRLSGDELDLPVDLLYQDGNYHLFYRYLSNGSIYRWGQSVSNDLTHWEHQSFDLEIDSTLSMGMGSMVYDWNNISGLSAGEPTMIAFYNTVDPENLAIGSAQFLEVAYSSDNGLSWHAAADRSIVLDNLYDRVSDTKVFWHEESQKWLMLVLAGYEIRFYASGNLVDWEYQSRFGDDVYLKDGNWTTVDFFPMELDESKELKWVLTISSDAGSPNEGSGIQYFVGDFDGFVYRASHNKPKWIDHGSDSYAGVVLGDYFANSQPACFMSAIENSIYTKFNIHPEKSGVFSFPREMSLKEMYHDYYLVSKPMASLKSLENKTQQLAETDMSGNLKIKETLSIPFEINLSFDVDNRLYLGMAEVFGVRMRNTQGQELIMGYHSERRYFFIAEPAISQQHPDTWDGFNYAPYVTSEPTMNFKIIVDQTSVELYAMDGLVTLTRKFAFTGDWNSIELFADGGTIRLNGGSITELNSVWQ